MHIFNKGDSDYHELLNDNFKELDTNNSELESTVTEINSSLSAYAKKTDVTAEIQSATKKVYQKSVGMGFGTTGTLTRIGNVVNLSVDSNQTTGRADGYVSLTEQIPSGYKPITAQAASAAVYVSGDLNADRYLLLYFSTSGSISSRSKNMATTPLTIALSATWLTSDAVPS